MMIVSLKLLENCQNYDMKIGPDDSEMRGLDEGCEMNDVLIDLVHQRRIDEMNHEMNDFLSDLVHHRRFDEMNHKMNDLLIDLVHHRRFDEMNHDMNDFFY
jgi:hypothetical protein